MRGKKNTKTKSAKAKPSSLKAKVAKAKLQAEQRAYKKHGEILASYKNARSTRLSTPWKRSEVTSGTPLITPIDGRNLRERSQQLEKDNPIAAALFARMTENVVGSGFKPQPLSADDDWNKQTHALLHGWFPYADFDGLSWLEHQRLSFHSYARDGDVGSIMVTKGEYPQLQLVEANNIYNDPETETPNCYDGVLTDQYGRAKAYSVLYVQPTGEQSWQRITAKNFILLKRQKRIRQLRGEPLLSPVLDLFDQVWGYLDAVIVAQRIAACYGIVIKQESPTTKLLGLPYKTNSAGQQQRQMNLEPGLVQSLNPGESIEQIEPSQPGHGFSENLRLFFQLIACCTGIPLELVLGDYSHTNFAGSRAARQDAYTAFAYQQQHYCEAYLSRIYRWRISKFIKDGQLKDRPDKFAHRWIGQPFPYLDPVTQAQADQINIDIGLSTQEEALLARGKNPSDHLRVRGAELQAQRDLKIPIYRSSYVAQVIENPTPVMTSDSKPPEPQGQGEDWQGNQGGEDERQAA